MIKELTQKNLSKARETFAQQEKERKRKNRKILLIVTFFTAVVLIVSTYAWLSQNLNVKVRFFKMSVAGESGLFISLDGIEFTDEIVISMDSIIMDLKETYPNHTNQWSMGGLWPISTNGIRNSNSDKFDVYEGRLVKVKYKLPNGYQKRLLHSYELKEDRGSAGSSFIAFDVFFKNVTGSPRPDNLYFDYDTGIFYEDDIPEEVKEQMDGLLNSTRIGLVKIGSVSSDSDINTIQNMKCNNECQDFIFDPWPNAHSQKSITDAELYGVYLTEGVPAPTYAIIAPGRHLEHTSGHWGTGLILDREHFGVQTMLTENDFDKPLFQVPNAITKARIYVWIEGQDVDSLETHSKGAGININISFTKDTAGYDEY